MSRFALTGRAATVFAALTVLFLASSPVWAQDADLDGVPDAIDNCPKVSNPDQANLDGDGFGNACDNCPTIPNDGADKDSDLIGDACDPLDNPRNISLTSGVVILVGQSYVGTLIGMDDDSTTWNLNIEFGDGSTMQKMVKDTDGDHVFTFNIKHKYTTAGTFLITATATDPTNMTNKPPAMELVKVLSLQDGIQDIIGRISKAGQNGTLPSDQAAALIAKLNAAILRINAGDSMGAKAQLRDCSAMIRAFVRSGVLPAADGNGWIDSINVILGLL